MKKQIQILVALTLLIIFGSATMMTAAAENSIFGTETGWIGYNADKKPFGTETGWIGYNADTKSSRPITYDDLGGIRWFVNSPEDYIEYEGEKINPPDMIGKDSCHKMTYKTKDGKNWDIRFIGINCIVVVKWERKDMLVIGDMINYLTLAYEIRLHTEEEAVQIVKDYCKLYEVVEIVHEFTDEDGNLVKGCYFYCKGPGDTEGYYEINDAELLDGVYMLTIKSIADQIRYYNVNQ